MMSVLCKRAVCSRPLLVEYFPGWLGLDIFTDDVICSATRSVTSGYVSDVSNGVVS